MQIRHLFTFIIITLAFSGFVAVTALAQGNSAAPRWEYMTANYAEYDNDMDNKPGPTIVVDNPEFAPLMLVCNEESNLRALEDCLEENGIGQSDMLALFGESGWELIQFDNTSTQYTYRATFFFKRPSV